MTDLQDLFDKLFKICGKIDLKINWSVKMLLHGLGSWSTLGLRKGCRNSTLMTCYYPDLRSATDCLKKIFNQSESVPRSGR